MLIATEFTILRDVVASGRESIPMERRPHRVATLINEKEFVYSGHQIIHNRTVFLEDYVHDWNWSDGKFRYYTRVAEKADVLIIYAEKDVPAEYKFCSSCGKPVTPGTGFICPECAEKADN